MAKVNKKFYIILDVETANTLDDALVYDLGIAVVDRKGKIYETFSLTIREVFFGMEDIMQSAYYANKLPVYRSEHRVGVRTIVNLYEAKNIIYKLSKKYNTLNFYAYNMNFDSRALNTTQRYLSKSKYRWFLPYGARLNCIWHMACQVICSQKTYIKWAMEKGFYNEKTGNIITNAETVYGYIVADETFKEAHTGLADVIIEAQILAHCIRQHKPMNRKINRLCWRIPQKVKKELQENEDATKVA